MIINMGAASTKVNASDLDGTVAIEKGGTGATTAADARTNLGITPANIGAADTTLSNVTKDTTPTSGSTNVVTSGGVYTAVNGKAPTSHASTATTYGAATSSNYGHVKLSDSTSSTSGASAGIAASPAAVKAAYDLANNKAPKYTYGTSDLTAGSSSLATGTLYFVYE